MQKESPVNQREFLTQRLDSDLVVAGGGLAGTCCAITAARAGIRVVLIQDRPVLGGNASSEVRMWVLGATSHMGNNNRWAREGGVTDEILVENLYRNPEGNPILFDALLLEKVIREPNISLLLNTAVIQVSKSGAGTIESVRAFCSQNETLYDVHAPLFCDATGDGVVGFLAGAAFRMGAEAAQEFGEKFAPTQEYGELLGHTIFFYSKEVGKPVKFIPPSFALADMTQIPKYHKFNAKEHGSYLWWIEYGGRLDTVHDTEKIKWELWRIVYGAWNYIKNSGRFPEAETLTLEWVGTIPGKRESRRFEGGYMLHQQDLVEQRGHYDAVSFGGWAIDLHPADGIFSDKPSCNQWHSRGVYQIPYRCLYSRNISNLFLAGRIISVSHVAFGSTRVQATCANSAQAVGIAAAICTRKHWLPADLKEPARMRELQIELMRAGQFIPRFRLDDPRELARNARISASSQLHLSRLAANGPFVPLAQSWAQMLPVDAGRAPKVSFIVNVAQSTTLQLELRTSNHPDNYTPNVILGRKAIALQPGDKQDVAADFDVTIETPRYLFYCLMRNEHVAVQCSEDRLTGVLSVANRQNPAVGNFGAQKPLEDIGVESFEFWCPERRPGGRNLALTIDPPLAVFAPANVANGIARPTNQPNAWVADWNDNAPKLVLQWTQPQTIARIDLSFDTDWDHPMENVFMGHPERAVPFCVKHYRICDGAGHLIAEQTDNHQTHNTIRLASPLTTNRLEIEIAAIHSRAPAALFQVCCYEN